MSALRPCPYCQRVDWSNAPALRDTLAWIDQQRGQTITSRDVADRFRVSISNASNRMDALARLGTLEQVGTENVRGAARDCCTGSRQMASWKCG